MTNKRTAAGARIAYGGIIQESNTFSLARSGMDDFRGNYVLVDEELAAASARNEYGGMNRAAAERGVVLLPTMAAASSVSSGRIPRTTVNELTDLLYPRLRAHLAAGCDGILLALHGAWCSEDEDDLCGELLSVVRAVAGPGLPIVITLDSHANVTRRIVDNVTALVGYRTFPHTDYLETGYRAASLLFDVLDGRCAPYIAFRKVPMIVQAENHVTSRGPMRELWREAEAGEQAGESAATSLFAVQPWLDVKEMGCSVVVIGDRGVRAEAEAEAKVEAEAETKAEAGTEAETEAGTEAETEAGTEAETEAGTEAETEAGTEAETEAGTEAEAKAGVEAKDKAVGEAEADRLARLFWEKRHAFAVDLYSVERVLDYIRERKPVGPVVVSDSADSPGAGSPGDSNQVLRELLRLGADKWLDAQLSMFDAAAAREANAAGSGQTVRMRVGHAVSTDIGEPLEIEGMVVRTGNGEFRFGGGFVPGSVGHMGCCAVIAIGRISLLLMERSVFTGDPAMYRSVGLEPAEVRLVLVKSAAQFRSEYEKLSGHIFILDTPGASTANLLSLPYRRLPRPMYPFDDHFVPGGWSS